MLIKILEENNIIFIINGIAYKGRFIKASHYQKKSQQQKLRWFHNTN